MTPENIKEQRARDALAFDPLPPSPWLTLLPEGIAITTNYSEALSRLLRGLPNNRWQPEHRRWLLPYVSAPNLRDAIPRIDALAAVAKESADAETIQREREREESARARRAAIIEADARRAASRPRPLVQHCLLPVEGRPLHDLALEAIGDDTAQILRHVGGGGDRQACAQVFGSNGRGGWVRAYLTGTRGFSRANGVGSRGIMVHYHLEEGPIYWVAAPQSWKSIDRYFLRILDGERVRMTEEEVRACLVK